MADHLSIRRDLSIEDLKRETKVTDEQLDTPIKETDLPEVAACFDNTDDYVEKLELTPGQQTDVNEVKAKAVLNRTLAGMKLALRYWIDRYREAATFRALLLIVLSLTRGDIAISICKCLAGKEFQPVSSTASQQPITAIGKYSNFLRKVYLRSKLPSKGKWPPSPCKKILKLAAIERDQHKHSQVAKLSRCESVNEYMLKNSMTPISMDDLLLFDKTGSIPKTVVVQGVPGIGKSTFAWKFCRK